MMLSLKHEVAVAGKASWLVDAARPLMWIFRGFEHFAIPELRVRRTREGAYVVGKLKASYCSTVGIRTETFATLRLPIG